MEEKVGNIFHPEFKVFWTVGWGDICGDMSERRKQENVHYDCGSRRGESSHSFDSFS